MKRANFFATLDALDACPEAVGWARGRKGTPKQIWEACERGDWLLWLAWRANPAHRDVYRAMCACARTALRHVRKGENRPRIAIETRERWCDGLATEEECCAAAVAACDAYATASDAAAAAAAAVAAAVAACDATAAAYSSAKKRALRRHAALVRKHVTWNDVEAGLTKLLEKS